MATEGVRYIKIARIDKNGIDQTNTLQSLNLITIPYTSGDITYTVINITENPTFFLYYVNPAEVDWDDRAELGYSFSSSYDGAQSLPFLGMPQLTPSLDNLSFFLEGGNGGMGNNTTPIDTYRIVTYPQKDLNIRISSSVQFGLSSKNPTTSVTASLRIVSSPLYPGQTPGFGSLPQPTVLATTILTSSIEDRDSATGVYFSGSYDLSATISSSEFTPGDCIYFQIFPQVDGGGPFEDCSLASPITFTNGFFDISSSLSTGQQVGLVPEPYFGSNDFNRALDCQPLLNNAERVRRHNLYQDVDYSAGTNEPVNFDLLISGSATRAEVQFSNYTTRRHVIPRYEGSKSTSKSLNRWTPGDKGTFGKIPTVESLKTVVAYCDFIGGWPPERMNASTAHILYIIDQDGNIGIPNTSENSLSNVQGAFQTGERFKINSETVGSGEATPFRTVIRGGQRIEPILYTQSGSNPGAQWTDIELIDIQTTSGSATSNYQNNGSVLPGTSYTFQQRLKLSTGQPNPSYIGSTGGYNYYGVPSAAVNDGVSLTFHLNQLVIGFFSGIIDNTSFRVGVILKINNDSFSVLQEDFNIPSKSSNIFTETLSNKSFTIPSSQLIAGQQISFEIQVDELQGELGLPGGVDEGVGIQFGSYAITQTPIPTQTISPSTVSNVTDIWGYYDKTNYPYVITSSAGVAASLGALYNDSNVRQKSTEGSGFNPIALPWEIEYGDEFRFEGDERYTYMVKEIYGPNEGSGSRLSQTGSIEVHFNGNLPISASWDNFNLDHFLIRRYVNDASQVIMEGFKPENSSGPFIITPEYVVPKMNKKVDEYITLLTEKGLL
jgi:hypothetical protein